MHLLFWLTVDYEKAEEGEGEEEEGKFEGLVLESYSRRKTAARAPGKWLLLQQGEQVVGGVGDVV